MSDSRANQSFTKPLQDLEQLANTRACLNSCDWNKLDSAVNREIQALTKALPFTFWGTSDQLLQQLQRLIIVKTKLEQQRSDWDVKGLNFLITKFESFGGKVSPGNKLKEKSLKFVPRNALWCVPIVSFTSKEYRYHQDDYEETLFFEFDPGNEKRLDRTIFLSVGTEYEYGVETDKNTIPFIAVFTIGVHPELRRIPVVTDFNLQSEVYDVEFLKTEDCQTVIDHLLGLGCTVIQRPPGNRAFHLGPDTTLREMAVKITDIQRV
ncbi:MAG: hypothetical protein Q9213_002265 [Squamulea squamosa]